MSQANRIEFGTRFGYRIRRDNESSAEVFRALLEAAAIGTPIRILTEIAGQNPPHGFPTDEIRSKKGPGGMSTTPRASQLIERLSLLIAEHGDLEVFTRDADTEWHLEIGIQVAPDDMRDRGEGRGGEQFFEITSSYYSTPAGNFD